MASIQQVGEQPFVFIRPSFGLFPHPTHLDVMLYILQDSGWPKVLSSRVKDFKQGKENVGSCKGWKL